MKQKINIAISMAWPNDAGSNIWGNGGNQHVLFMYLLFKQLPYVNNVWIVSHQKEENFLPNNILDQISEDLVLFDDVMNEVDFFLEMSAYVEKKHADIVRKRGGKVVSYKYGNDYIVSVESLSLGGHKGWVLHPESIAFDEVWTNEQHVHTCYSYFKHMYKAPVKVLPHVWSPFFVDNAIAENSQTALGWPYKQRAEKARVNVFEPNINVVKSSIIPFFVASKFYDDNPEIVSNIYLTNCLRLVENPLFVRLVAGTRAGADKVASAEPRHSFVDFMGQYGGIVLHHQWENGLNYLYYEALYGGFPLVHNSPLIKDFGYYYREFDIDDGARALERAWHTHDENLEEYRATSQKLLDAVSPYSDSVIKAYDERLQALMA